MTTDPKAATLFLVPALLYCIRGSEQLNYTGLPGSAAHKIADVRHAVLAPGRSMQSLDTVQACVNVLSAIFMRAEAILGSRAGALEDAVPPDSMAGVQPSDTDVCLFCGRNMLESGLMRGLMVGLHTSSTQVQHAETCHSLCSKHHHASQPVCVTYV